MITNEKKTCRINTYSKQVANGYSPTNFQNNMQLPVHRWYRYITGFSAQWAGSIIKKEKKNNRTHILDPFAGSGTTLIEAELNGVESIGIEAHPFVFRMAQAKLLWREDFCRLRHFADEVLGEAKNIEPDISSYSELIHRCYPVETLKRLDKLKQAWMKKNNNTPESILTWFALVSILRKCSPVGTASWQYIQPKKVKSYSDEPYITFDTMVTNMFIDMAKLRNKRSCPKANLIQGDARQLQDISEGWADLVITSPPYINNYDYADATRLEMTFLGEIETWSDLRDKVRMNLVRSCTQHVSPISEKTFSILESQTLDPIRDEMIKIVEELESEKRKHVGKKQYPTMIAAYFKDMAEVWKMLRKYTSDDALVSFVIGDSAPYGIYVPVDEWLGELALSAGFSSYYFEKVRDRNIKWKNRKHNIPLKEGYLWVHG